MVFGCFLFFFLTYSKQADKTTAELTGRLLHPAASLFKKQALHYHIAQWRRLSFIFLHSLLSSSHKSCLSCQTQPAWSHNDKDGPSILATTNKPTDPRYTERQTTLSVCICSRFLETLAERRSVLDWVLFICRILEIPSSFQLTANTLKYEIVKNLKPTWFRARRGWNKSPTSAIVTCPISFLRHL